MQYSIFLPCHDVRLYLMCLPFLEINVSSHTTSLIILIDFACDFIHLKCGVEPDHIVIFLNELTNIL